MLTIYLHSSQTAIIEELREHFPDLTEARAIYPGYAIYHTYPIDGPEGQEQCRWLRTMQILFIDTEIIRERRTRAFFQGVELDDKPLRGLNIQRIDNDPDEHRVTLRGREREIHLRLPLDWIGKEIRPYHPWLNWLYICQEEEWYIVFPVNAMGCLGATIHQAQTASELEVWLLEQRFLQFCCFTYNPSVCGLYMHLSEHTLLDLLETQ